MVGLQIAELSEADLNQATTWFTDLETQKYLGDENWLSQISRLLGINRKLFGFKDSVDTLLAVADVEIYSNASAAIALVVAPSHRHKGFGLAVLAKLVDYLPQYGVEMVTGGVNPDNQASLTLLKKAGWVYQKTDAEGYLDFSYQVSKK